MTQIDAAVLTDTTAGRAAVVPGGRGRPGRAPTGWRRWRVQVGLIALTFVPAVAGAFRLTELAGDPPVTADNERFVASPAPVVLHIVGATVFCLLGAFQFDPVLRRRRPRWHRAAGRVLIPCGIVAALSGLWMTVFSDLPAQDNAALNAIRLVVGTAMAASLVLGLVAARRRDFAAHRAWVTRGYALGLGAGTQAFVIAPWMMVTGNPTGNFRAVLMLAAWSINLAVAEWALRRGRASRPAGQASRAWISRVAWRRRADSERAMARNKASQSAGSW
ncbi:DUF2306 domain-containing protein [Frankia sp. CNm7]|uniref:DUF2306 domain-containing protein n=1 Tax=Frankia nepalensis TaxID=1836974 RepID=A0A937UQK3_9ACTN|nr:DUF2306 domain-containing protein [Frankia nepalensis]MBL7497108.1 DUF2306 domain-containing protein [Frankia nepalensis]MBL7510780.1 DUF2306 domain-containing protein [Frankia nepalensis]MBL7521556.1 DUF2306 domain-containing protein [Frankia nepalensis]MBL7626791.1 DUF2306 domain-containing protein [Frankia nepalensis]